MRRLAGKEQDAVHGRREVSSVLESPISRKEGIASSSEWMDGPATACERLHLPDTDRSGDDLLKLSEGRVDDFLIRESGPSTRLPPYEKPI